MKQLTELDRYILKQEFPQLSLTEDPDIERYFEFRAQNRQADALKIYNAKLIHRYPDSRTRVLLMTYYRRHDARFQLLLADSLARLAETTITQVKKIIVFFTGTVAPLKTAKVYSIIQVCEKVISAISSDRFAAISFTEKYVRYADTLRYHAEEMRQAADMLRMYITDTISSVREFREERVRDARERNRKAAQQSHVSMIDFSKITFTRQQIAAITIAPSIRRTEDKVLAYTVKYWDRYDDGAFENTLLLYSRKYGTNHYAVFQAVKIARIRKWKDDELLHAVLANVAQGYYYSISGDLYLQRSWKQIKLKLEAGAPPEEAAAPSAKPKRQKKAKAPTRKPRSGKAVAAAESLQDKKTRGAAGTQRGSSALKTTARAVSAQPVTTPLSSTSDSPVRAARAAQKAAGKQPQDSAGKQAAPLRIYPQPASKEGQLSIADTVKKVTGKSYGIYRELFFKEVRTSIRAILQYSAIHKLSFFGNEQNNAEDIIYQFLETNYDNPYQQWQGSQDQADVLEEGFRIDSLEPIIRHWAQHNI